MTIKEKSILANLVRNEMTQIKARHAAQKELNLATRDVTGVVQLQAFRQEWFVLADILRKLGYEAGYWSL